DRKLQLAVIQPAGEADAIAGVEQRSGDLGRPQHHLEGTLQPVQREREDPVGKSPLGRGHVFGCDVGKSLAHAGWSFRRSVYPTTLHGLALIAAIMPVTVQAVY